MKRLQQHTRITFFYASALGSGPLALKIFHVNNEREKHTVFGYASADFYCVFLSARASDEISLKSVLQNDLFQYMVISSLRCLRL